MKLLDDSLVLEDFFASVVKAPARALLLDYDGTLAPFTVERDKAYPYPGVRDALDALMGTGRCRVVIISGRYAYDLLPLLGLKNVPEIWGSHGWERLGPAGYEPPELDPYMRGCIDEIAHWAHDMHLDGRLELKPASAAFHVRGLDPDESARLSNIAKVMMELLASSCGMEVHDFDGGVELRAPGRDKGHAVKTVLGESGKDAAVAYLGDDLTDEDAFRVLRNRGLGVLVRAEPRDTAARLWIRPPEELLWFIGRWAAACGG